MDALLLKEDCCGSCDLLQYVHGDPPYHVCRLSGTDEWDCEKNQEAQRLCEAAERDIETAHLITDEARRHQWATTVADAWADVLWPNATFDTDTFVARCMAAVEVPA